jgi:N-acetyl sugar amidotransferase
MDDSNPAIQFDANGQCDCCRDAFARRQHEWWPGLEGAHKLRALTAMLREQGRGKAYDAMVGLSGGIDSAYLAHLLSRDCGLRLLAVHVDGGWNSEAAVRNIESIVRGLNIDLHTYVVEWQEMCDLQLAFLRASVLNQDIPQDHAFLATLYRTANTFQQQYFLSGVNFASENIVPPNWGHTSIDGRHVRAIHARFGRAALETFPIIGLSEYLWMTRITEQLTIHRPLNYINYNRENARHELTNLYGWRDYGSKHSESRFTKFYQEIYLPSRYGFDKRRLHLSSLIVSGQLTRARALVELADPIAQLEHVSRDIRFVAKKLGISETTLMQLIHQKPLPHTLYASESRLHSMLSWVRAVLRRISLRVVPEIKP